MASYDVKRELKQFYAPRNSTWEVLEVPPQRFLAVDGAGDPNTSADHGAAVAALYAVAYTLKFTNTSPGHDFVVAPLEGLWWARAWEAFALGAKQSWQWTMLISQPEWITAEMIASAKETAKAKKGLPAIERVRPLELNEGWCAQVLHIGPYDDEGPVLADLHESYLPHNGFEPVGLHHEIYLGDPRRAAPEKLRTVLRQPVRPLSGRSGAT